MTNKELPSKRARLLILGNVTLFVLAAVFLGRLQINQSRSARESRENLQSLTAKLEKQALEFEQEMQATRALQARLDELNEKLAKEQKLLSGDLQDLEFATESKALAASKALANTESRIGAEIAKLDRGQKNHNDALALISQKPNLADRVRGLMRHTVRINAKSEVGSGVIVFNAERGSPKVLETYVLTAYHVIKDNFVTKEGEKEPVQVDIYPRKNDRITVISEVLQVQTELDVALLRIRTNLIANPAKPADPEILAGLDLFSKVVTIGCPLGYEPMPTRGELMSRSKVFDKRTFWMMSAPTIFGNSGGGVFDAGSGCLLGLLVRIAAYKNVIDVAVPHLGIVTPIAEIENWLEKTGFGFVLKTGSRLDAKPLDASQGKK